MKAPEKVYVLCDYDGRPGNVDIYPLGKRSQEYICKDALLEWANNLEKIGVSDDFAYAIQTLIKHINSL